MARATSLDGSAGLLRDTKRRGLRARCSPPATRALGFWAAEDKTHALAAVKTFEQLFGAKFPEAVAKIDKQSRRFPMRHLTPASRPASASY